MKPLRPRFFPLLPALLSLSACFQPTYRRATLAASVEEVCRREYKMDVSAHLVGSTLYTKQVVENLVDDGLELQSDKFKALDNMLRVLSRVAQSSDANLQFLVIELEDSRLASRFTVLQRVDDYYRLRDSRISPDEFQERLVFEWSGDSPETSQTAPHDIELPEFLARATAARLQRRLVGNPLVSVLLPVRAIRGEVTEGTLTLTLEGLEKSKSQKDVERFLLSPLQDIAGSVLKTYDPESTYVQRLVLEDEMKKSLWSEEALFLLAAAPSAKK